MIRIKILILSAHPDDECLGCGGTIARLSSEGHEVNILILATGLTSRGETFPEEITYLQAQAESAASILGAKAIHFGDFPDNAMDTIPLLTIAQEIEKALNLLRPDVIYTHHGGDCNQDHRAVFQATLVATRPTAASGVKALYTFETPSSTEWAFDGSFVPNTFVDISGEYLERKITAMEMYESERRAFPHPRSPEALRALATWRGAQAGLMAAEAFQLVRCIR